jgi:ribosomal protein S18 acetylase RimI-like enzyme
MESIDRTAVLLDHVVWSCLSGPHSRFAIGDGQAKRYPPDIAMFGAVRPPGLGTSAELATLLQGQSNVAIVAAAELRPFASGEPSLRVPVDQMLLVEPARLDSVGGVQCNPLAAADVPEMMRLVDATRPGPFAARTIEMGRYIGVRVRGRLVAMGGERLRVPGFTEISAICVDPEYRGRGHAAGIIKDLCGDILARGERAFLHVVSHNSNAIALYERLGFARRRRFVMNVFDSRA